MTIAGLFTLNLEKAVAETTLFDKVTAITTQPVILFPVIVSFGIPFLIFILMGFKAVNRRTGKILFQFDNYKILLLIWFISGLSFFLTLIFPIWLKLF